MQIKSLGISKSNNKIDSLQIMRGYAAVLVAICHIWNDGWLPGTLVELGGSGVDLFFVLSGFIMCLTVKLNLNSKQASAKYFLKKRIVRIFPIYLICAIPLILFNTYAEGVKSPYFYIGNVLLLPSFTDDPSYYYPLGPGWSLTYEMLFYYSFAAFILFTSSKKVLSLSLMAFLFALVSTVRILGLQGPQLGWVNFSFIIGDTMLINFGLGIATYFIYDFYKNKVNINIRFSIFWLMFWALVSGLLIHLDYSRFIAYGIPAFFITIVFTLTNNATIKGRLMKGAVFIGDASYSIYLTHFYFAFIKPKFLLLGNHFSLDKNIYLNLIDMTLFLLSIVCGCLFYIYVEKPIIRYFSNKPSKIISETADLPAK